MERKEGKKEKREMLLLRQKELLKRFLESGAISRAQYEKSLRDLIAKWPKEGPEG